MTMPPEQETVTTSELEEMVAKANKRYSENVGVSLPLKETMLDMFPLSEQELHRLLWIHQHFSSGKVGFSDMLQATEEVEHLKRIRQAEAIFVPESSLIIQHAYRSAFVIGSGDYDDSELFRFLEAVVCLLGRRGSQSLLRIVYKVAALDADHATPLALVSFVHRLILGSYYLKSSYPNGARPTPDSWIKSLADRSLNNDGKITEDSWIDWVNAIAPQVYQALSTFVHYAIFTPQHPFRSTSLPLSLPEASQESALWKHSCQTIPSSLALLSPSLGGRWVKHFSSDSDGCSFATFQQALLAYQGPTAILILTTAGDAFGFYSDTAWRESMKWFGQGSDSFLFGLKPSLQYYGPTGDKTYNMFLHNPATKRPGDLYGLAVGGIAAKTPRLHITTTFEQCMAGSMDSVFGSGPLLSNEEIFFDVDVIEIWAVNASEEEYAKYRSAGKQAIVIREGRRIKAAQVDRKHFLEDFQSGQFSNSLFAHREQTRGRHSFCADDDEERGYYIEEFAPTPKPYLKIDGNS